MEKAPSFVPSPSFGPSFDPDEASEPPTAASQLLEEKTDEQDAVTVTSSVVVEEKIDDPLSRTSIAPQENPDDNHVVLSPLITESKAVPPAEIEQEKRVVSTASSHSEKIKEKENSIASQNSTKVNETAKPKEKSTKKCACVIS